MLPKISIIVPVYNVESYLPRCIDSIINQTHKNLYIILIDDGSTDNSGAICDEYARKDVRIKAIHKQNGGLSDARNVGLDICKLEGEYIAFVDSDDYIEKDMYEILYKFSKDNDLDVAMCGAYDVVEDRIIKHGYFPQKILDKKSEIIEELFVNRRGGASVAVWNKLYKKDVLCNIRFDKDKWYEDVFFILKWIEKIERFGRISDNKYFYIQRANSITNQNKFSNKILDVIDGYDENLEIIKKRFPASIEAGEYRLWWAYRFAIERILKCSDCNDHLDVVTEIQQKIRTNWFKIFSNKYLNLKEKNIYILLMINIDLYRSLKKLKTAVHI